MAYTLEFEIAGDADGSGHTGTATFFIVVDGSETNLGTKTTPVDSAVGRQWGARSFDVTSQFDPDSRSVEVQWQYSSGSDAVNIRNLRITDGTDEWLDQWGERGDPWDHAHPWAADGSSTPVYYAWGDFADAIPGSTPNAFSPSSRVHHFIRTAHTGSSWTLKMDITPDPTSTGSVEHHYSQIEVEIDVDATTTALGKALTSTEQGNDGTYDYIEWTSDLDGVFDPLADEVTVRWRYVLGADACHSRNLSIENPAGTTVYGDQYRQWDGDLANTQVALDGSSSPQQLDPCASKPTATDGSPGTWEVDPYGDGWVNHLILPQHNCATFRPMVGRVGLMRV